MGLRSPRGKFERLDTILSARIWRTADRADPAIGATCRNLSSRGCRLSVEDDKLAPGFTVDSPIWFSIWLDPSSEVRGGGQVVWLRKERGEPGKIRLILGIEFTSVSFADQERIKAFITTHSEW